MFNFETLHKNHKYAFLDGLLCGMMLAWMANSFYKDYQEDEAYVTLVEETIEEQTLQN